MGFNATGRCNCRIAHARGPIAVGVCWLSLCAQLGFGSEPPLDSQPRRLAPVTDAKAVPHPIATTGPTPFFADKLASFATSDPPSAERFAALEARVRELEGANTSDTTGAASAELP